MDANAFRIRTSKISVLFFQPSPFLLPLTPSYSLQSHAFPNVSFPTFLATFMQSLLVSLLSWWTSLVPLLFPIWSDSFQLQMATKKKKKKRRWNKIKPNMRLFTSTFLPETRDMRWPVAHQRRDHFLSFWWFKCTLQWEDAREGGENSILFHNWRYLSFNITVYFK